jgi:tRNA threonylcarbamoyladenosine biosynthesis protein TsaE
MEIITKSPEETKEFGQKIGSLLSGGEILAFQGDLGSGKTTLIQGIAHSLGLTGRITSPTFILMRTYSLPDSKIHTFYHLDFYRLEGDIPRQVKELGITDMWGKPGTVTIIEWAEKAKELLPKETRWFHFEHIDEEKRKIFYR